MSARSFFAADSADGRERGEFRVRLRLRRYSARMIQASPHFHHFLTHRSLTRKALCLLTHSASVLRCDLHNHERYPSCLLVLEIHLVRLRVKNHPLAMRLFTSLFLFIATFLIVAVAAAPTKNKIAQAKSMTHDRFSCPPLTRQGIILWYTAWLLLTLVQ